MNDPYTLIHAKGSPVEIGRELGHLHRKQIQKVVEANFLNFHEIFKKKSLTYLPKDRFVSLAKRYVPYAEEFAPELIDEIKGMAEAAEISFEELFAHNCLLDFDDLAYPFLADQILFGCTTFGIDSISTRNSLCYIGQNYDYRSVFKDTGMVVHISPENGPDALVWTMGGLLGCMGINSAGITVAINKLVPNDSRIGIPHTFLIRKILQQERLGDAVAVIVGARRATGIHYVLGDASGQVLALETTAANYEAIYPTEGYMAHTNHYVTIPLRPYESFRRSFSTDSITRYGRMQRLLKESTGYMDVDLLFSLLSDHLNFPYSICRHEAEDMDESLIGKTIASIVMEPQNRCLHIRAGNPCQSELQTFNFS